MINLSDLFVLRFVVFGILFMCTSLVANYAVNRTSPLVWVSLMAVAWACLTFSLFSVFRYQFFDVHITEQSNSSDVSTSGIPVAPSDESKKAFAELDDLDTYDTYKIEYVPSTFSIRRLLHIKASGYKCTIDKKTGVVDIKNINDVSMRPYKMGYMLSYNGKDYYVNSIDNCSTATCIKYNKDSVKTELDINNKPCDTYEFACLE